ncbi:hypothetical protein [Glutamicibacter sp. Je.9.36]|uniref:hypothetical protein n=1 Tax=Glutamicibacter sp. Je.9.36 TaxID=3142837 RepID=UPI003DA9CD47
MSKEMVLQTETTHGATRNREGLAMATNDLQYLAQENSDRTLGNDRNPRIAGLYGRDHARTFQSP